MVDGITFIISIRLTIPVLYLLSEYYGNTVTLQATNRNLYEFDFWLYERPTKLHGRFLRIFQISASGVPDSIDM